MGPDLCKREPRARFTVAGATFDQLVTSVGQCDPRLPLGLRHLTAAIAVVRARVPLGAAALTSYSPEDDHDQGVCRAAFAAIDAIVANGA